MNNKTRTYRNIWTIIMLLLMSEVYGQKISYNLEEPEKFNLPRNVDEISGITYLNDSVLLAIDDEHGQLFQFSLIENIEVRGYKFGLDKL